MIDMNSEKYRIGWDHGWDDCVNGKSKYNNPYADENSKAGYDDGWDAADEYSYY